MVSQAVIGIAWIAGGLILAYVVIWLSRYIESIARKSQTLAPLIAHVSIPLAIAGVVVGVQGALVRFGVTKPWVYHVFVSVLVALGAYCLIAVTSIMVKEWLLVFVRKTKTRADDNFVPLVQGVVKLLILVLAFALILSQWGVHVGPLIAGLGIAGLAIGLALQGTMANIISGISLILDETYNVGDVVKLDTGEIGEVIHIGLRSTKILTEDQQLMTLPNSTIANSKLINYSLPTPNLRIVLDVGVAYGSRVDKVRKVLLGSLKGVEEISDRPAPVVHFKEMGESSINFQLKFFIDDYRDRHEVRSEALRRVYENLQLAGIEIPYPTRSVYVKK